jgi:hypothetical protein
MKKKQRTLTLIIAILFAGFLFSCKKEEVGGFEEYDANIVGKWQVIADLGWGGEPIDYLPYNIIYDFRENNTLHVSGITDSIQDYKWHQPGEYSYKTFRHRPLAIEPNTQAPAGVPPSPRIEINSERYSLHFIHDSYHIPGIPSIRLFFPKFGAIELVRIEDLAEINQK